MSKLRTVVKYHGGKSPLMGWITQYFPQDLRSRRFFDVYGGGATVVLQKVASREDTYNDLNVAMVALLNQIKNNLEPLQNFLASVSYSEATFLHWKSFVPSSEMTLAIRQLIIHRFSRGGLGKTFAWSERLRGGQPGDLNAWCNFVTSGLKPISDRLQAVSLLNEPALDVIRREDNEDVLFYLDPPYMPTTRTATKIYEYEMTEQDHIELLATLKRCRAKIMLAGYSNELYRDELKGWRVVEKDVANHAGQGDKKQRRVETMWLNW